MFWLLKKTKNNLYKNNNPIILLFIRVAQWKADKHPIRLQWHNSLKHFQSLGYNTAFSMVCTASSDPRFDPHWRPLQNSGKRLKCVRSRPCSEDSECRRPGQLPAICVKGKEKINPTKHLTNSEPPSANSMHRKTSIYIISNTENVKSSVGISLAIAPKI